jgi:hypothetical protein
MFIVIVIVIPLLFVVAMHLMEFVSDRAVVWQRRLMKLGWDICVLAMGLTGGLFADDAIFRSASSLSPLAPIGLLLLSVVASLLAAIVILSLRQSAPVGWRAFLCLTLGSCTLALPVYIALFRR